MKRLILAIGTVAALTGCYGLWTHLQEQQREAMIARMAAAEREEALAPLHRLMADAVRVEPQTLARPSAGTKVILTAPLIPATVVNDPDLGLSRPDTLGLIRLVSALEVTKRQVERQVYQPKTPANLHSGDHYRTVRETKTEANWQPLTKPRADFPLVTSQFWAKVKAGEWPMTPALLARIEAREGVPLAKSIQERVATLAGRPVSVDKGTLRVEAPAGQVRLTLAAVPAGTYTVLAVWNGEALDVWQDPQDGAELGIVRPGSFDDLIPPQLRTAP